jgi:polar amino acid transport system permease protein
VIEKEASLMIEMLIETLPLLLKGARNALSVTIVSMIIALPLGLLIGLMRMSKVVWVQKFALLYIEIWRAVPFIVELLFVYFVLPQIVKRWFQIEIRAFDAMVLGCVLWTTATSAEVFRGAIQAIPFGQTEAAVALGMSYFQRMRLVIMPQALKISLIGLYTLVLKGTAVGFIIDYRELVRMAQIAIERLFMEGRTSASIEIYTVIMIMYFVMCYPLSQLSLYFERKLAKGISMREDGL